MNMRQDPKDFLFLQGIDLLDHTLQQAHRTSEEYSQHMPLMPNKRVEWVMEDKWEEKSWAEDQSWQQSERHSKEWDFGKEDG